MFLQPFQLSLDQDVIEIANELCPDIEQHAAANQALERIG